MRLILASASPSRAEILRNAGFEFSIYPADVDESRSVNEGADDYVLRLLATKARLVADRVIGSDSPAIVIGADTVVLVGRPNSRKARRRAGRASDAAAAEWKDSRCSYGHGSDWRSQRTGIFPRGENQRSFSGAFRPGTSKSTLRPESRSTRRELTAYKVSAGDLYQESRDATST